MVKKVCLFIIIVIYLLLLFIYYLLLLFNLYLFYLSTTYIDLSKILRNLTSQKKYLLRGQRKQ